MRLCQPVDVFTCSERERLYVVFNVCTTNFVLHFISLSHGSVEMECQDADNTVNSTPKKNDDEPFEVENNVLWKLRNCTLIPRTLSDFQDFVSRLVNDPISESVIEEVWRQIYISSDGGLSHINSSESTNNPVVSQVNCLEGKHGENHNEMPEFSDVNSARATTENPQIVSDDYMPKSADQTNDHVCLEEEHEYVSSSDCEVVEVVSLNISNEGNNNHSCSKLDSNIDSYESDSDKSVEILELKNYSKTYANNDEQPCLVHGNTSYRDSCNIPECSHCASKNTQTCLKHLNKDVNIKDIGVSTSKFVNKKRKLKYKKLKSEVKNLKCLLENLLMNVDSSVIGSANNRRENVSLSSVNFTPRTGASAKKTVKMSTKELNILEERVYSCRKKCKTKRFQKEDERILHDNINLATDEKNPSKIVKLTGDILKKKVQTSEHSKTVHEVHRSEKIRNLNTHFPGAKKKKRTKFKWREVIVETLKENEGNRMQVEKLKRKVIASYYCYRGNISQNTEWKFFKYLHATSGVVINADVAIYRNNMKTQISSTSERKKQLVMKTVTRTRELKLS